MQKTSESQFPNLETSEILSNSQEEFKTQNGAIESNAEELQKRHIKMAESIII